MKAKQVGSGGEGAYIHSLLQVEVKILLAGHSAEPSVRFQMSNGDAAAF